MIKFSSLWNKSIKPKKQRKFRFNAPLHIKTKFLNAHLSKDLREKYKTRSVPLRSGDKVKVITGQFKGIIGAVTKVYKLKSKIEVENVFITKKDGSKVFYPINPSNIMIIDLKPDKKRKFSKITKE